MIEATNLTEKRKSALRRDLRLVNAVGVGLGAIISTRIFVVTGAAASVAGPAFIIGLLLAGVAATHPQLGGTNVGDCCG